MLDYPDFVRFIVKPDLEHIGESEDVLWAIAEVNTDAKMPTPTTEEMPNGKDAMVFDYDLGAVYAWRYAMAHGAATVSVPKRDLGFVTLDDRPDSFAMMAVVTLSYFLKADHPVSPMVYRLENGNVVGTGGAIQVPDADAS